MTQPERKESADKEEQSKMKVRSAPVDLIPLVQKFNCNTLPSPTYWVLRWRGKTLTTKLLVNASFKITIYFSWDNENSNISSIDFNSFADKRNCQLKVMRSNSLGTDFGNLDVRRWLFYLHLTPFITFTNNAIVRHSLKNWIN